MKRIGTVVISALALALSGGLAFGVNPPHAGDDHFLCYKDKDVSPTKFTAVTVTLADQFESGSYTVSKNKAICAPGNKNNEGVVDNVTHLVSYSVKASGIITLTPDPRTNIKVVNQFHPLATPLTVDIGKGDRLLVPANKAIAPATPPGPPALTINVDHYRCYKAKVTKGQPKFAAITNVLISTQFDGNAVRNYTLKKPSRLCAPTNKNSEGFKDQLSHLMCYKASLTKTPVKQAKHTPASANTADQFGTRALLTSKEDEICVPSLKNPPTPVCGNNLQEIGEGCDGTDDSACPGQCQNTLSGAIPICQCPGPHPFNIASGSNAVVRGVLGLDSDAIVIPLTGQFFVVNAPETPPGSGVIPIAILPVRLPPLLALGMNVCPFLVDLNDGSGTAGQGVLNCNGVPLPLPTPPSSDYRLFQDHCTQSASPLPSGCDSSLAFAPTCTVPEFGGLPGILHAGVAVGEPAECVTALPPDPTCVGMSPTGSKASLEVTGHCSVTIATLCASGADCPSGETCVGHCSVTTATDCTTTAGCPAGEVCGDPGPHPGVCNSGVFFVPGTGAGAPAWAAQAAFIQVNLLIKQQSSAIPCPLRAGKCKLDTALACDRNLDCNTMPADTCVTGANLQPFTTTVASSAVMDWRAASPAPASPTVQAFALTGVNLSCVSLLNSVTSGAHLVSSIPALDQGIPLPPGVTDLNLGTTFIAQ